MKKIALLFLVSISLHVFSQEKITEGVVIQKQTISTLNEQMNAHLAAMGEMVTTTYFKGGKSRSELSNAMIGESIAIIDNDKKEMLVLLNSPMMGKKYLTKSIELSEDELNNVSVKETNEVKIFLGYECKRYDVILNKDGVDVEMLVFVTEKLNISTKKSTAFGNKLKGFPLFMEIKTNQMGTDMTIKIETTEIRNEKVADSKFDMTVPESFEKVQNLPGM